MRDENAAVASYEGLCHYLADRYFVRGLDRDDLIQEARIGALMAIRTYDRYRTHRTEIAFVRLCAERRLQTAVTASRRQHRRAQYEAISMHGTLGPDEDADLTLENVIAGPWTVEDQVEAREELHAAMERIDTRMTPAEGAAIVGIAVGCSYDEVGASGAFSFNGSRKQVDNAAQRGLAKLRAVA